MIISLLVLMLIVSYWCCKCGEQQAQHPRSESVFISAFILFHPILIWSLFPRYSTLWLGRFSEFFWFTLPFSCHRYYHQLTWKWRYWMRRPGNTIFYDYQPTRLQVTSDVAQMTLHEYLSMIPPSGVVDDFNNKILNGQMKPLERPVFVCSLHCSWGWRNRKSYFYASW